MVFQLHGRLGCTLTIIVFVFVSLNPLLFLFD